MAGTLRFVSAGAGTGKTYRLTEILHEKLRSKQARPGGVIAMTFTRKAAAELRERVRTALLEKGEFALANAMGQARIGTVNSVCGGLLDRFAFEARSETVSIASRTSAPACVSSNTRCSGASPASKAKRSSSPPHTLFTVPIRA